MTDLPKIFFANRELFRSWLEENHNKSDGFWMIFYKKWTKKENISYDDAVEEALCFGWIDSIIKKIDEEKFVRKFTPRTNTKNWSELNKSRVLALIDKGLMTKAGLEKIDIYNKTGKVSWKNPKTGPARNHTLEIPEFLSETFAENEPALANFNNMAPSYQRQYILWITSAKREETLQKRINEAILLLKNNKKMGMR